MIEGSSVPEHKVMMLSLVERLKDLHADFEREDTYIDVILQSLSPSFDQFIVKYNMNGRDKNFHELINMLAGYEVRIKKSELLVLVGEASTSKAKGKMLDVGKGRRMRHHQLLLALQALLLRCWVGVKERERGFGS
ncbi:hypothetical protein Sango_2686400 [Sesamum angolense]|uniref:Uncharacterized protein n=1 Tax=Sesamum angolense TaxID=2727404 RepID=A0AAE2BHH6_9LAMI|nr:hypothetical protein Sango_2686400 [Sesamum angolense]